MIACLTDYVKCVSNEVDRWNSKIGYVMPWFRGESDHPIDDERDKPLCPKIARYTKEEENYLLQSFRRKARGIANTPPREETDLWLFLAQHYGLATRLLDWSESALNGLYFAINGRRSNPRVYMLDPHKLNSLAIGCERCMNFPLTWANKAGYENIALAWELRNPERGYELPVAVPAAYQDSRMIAQRSCFTIHGRCLSPLADLLRARGVELNDYLIEFAIDHERIDALLSELAIFGVSAASIYPDLDNMTKDIVAEINRFKRESK